MLRLERGGGVEITIRQLAEQAKTAVPMRYNSGSPPGGNYWESPENSPSTIRGSN